MQGFLLLTLFASASATTVSPIEKILQLLGDLQAKIIKDGDEQQKIYEEFSDFCNDESKATSFEIETGHKDAERFSATVADSTAEIASLETKIEETASKIATDTADLKAAKDIRDQEHADFLESDQDMSETVSALSRAIAIIEKEMSKSSFMQTDSMDKVAAALQALVSVVPLNAMDKSRVQALLETDDSQPGGAPAAKGYESQSGGIMSVLEDMLEKAEAQQSEAQKAEMTAAHNFAMLKQGLEDATAAATKELAEAKKAKAKAEETKAEAEGELERTNTELAADQKRLKDLQHECMTKAEEYDLESKETASELDALATAKKIIQEKTGGASTRTYGESEEAASFLQVKSQSKAHARVRAVEDKIVSLLQNVAKDAKATELAQLAARVRSTMQSESDPFAKVKGMIQEMVEKLVKEAADEAGKKAFCDKEMSETKAKMEDKQGEVDDLQTSTDKFEAKIAKLTEAIATLESELGEIAAAQKQADEMRGTEKSAWKGAKADFEQGLEGIQMALQVLRDYYAEKEAPALIQDDGDLASQMKHMSLAQTTKSSGAASGIIGMLEVAESDFSKMLSEGQSAEDQLQKEYETVSQDNEVSTAKKETEAKYSAKDKKETTALLADTKEDMGVSQTELSAILEYWAKLQPQCVAKPEPYEERKARREREIAGLKEALEILEAESAPAFLQRS